MPGLLSAFGKAASFTAKGAAVTFGSTVFSCAAACTIEKGANRMIYKYFPEKFANVEAASGITQEELDFVKYCYGSSSSVAAETEGSSVSTATEPELLYRYDSYDDSSVEHSPLHDQIEHAIHMDEELQESSTTTFNKFWTEQEDTAKKYISMIPVVVPRQEILACSMTA